MSSFLVVTLLLTGAVSGLAAGLLGVGGGLIIVPALAHLLPLAGDDGTHTMQVALGSSLAVICFTALSSARAHHGRDAVDMAVLRRMAPGLAFGALAGVFVAVQLTERPLRVVFGLFELGVALHLLRARIPDRVVPVAPAVEHGVAAVIGAVSGIVGIGGGTLTVPWLHWRGLTMHRSVATAAACGFPIALAGTIGYGAAGHLPLAVVGPAIALIASASVVAAPLGARLAHRLPAAALRTGFASFLAVLGLKMLLG